MSHRVGKLELESSLYNHQFSSSIILTYALRCHIAVDLHLVGPHLMDEQKMKLQVCTNVLWRKIMSWINIQHLYMPSLHVLCERDDHCLPPNQPEEPVSDIKLYLPSSITLDSNIVCNNRLCQLEWELHQAQAEDALHELCDSLHLWSYMYMDKDRFQRGQCQNTRSCGIIDHLEVKVNVAAAKYWVTQQAISTLASPLNQVG